MSFRQNFVSIFDCVENGRLVLLSNQVDNTANKKKKKKKKKRKRQTLAYQSAAALHGV
jgi:hypothetical protein